MSQDRLRHYRDRRDFRRSPEPTGSGGRKVSSRPIFVIQKHAASQLHYDFRLELDGALMSWAVPKGPSLDPRERRLAVRTEDHPMDYADFEGVIPQQEYGGGTVMVWDAGTWKNRSRDNDDRPVSASRALKAGKLQVELWGRKLRGGWALIRTDSQDSGQEKWLLIKQKDEHADARRKPTSSQPDSVLTERSLKDIAADDDSGDSGN